MEEIRKGFRLVLQTNALKSIVTVDIAVFCHSTFALRLTLNIRAPMRHDLDASDPPCLERNCGRSPDLRRGQTDSAPA
jgi:hypothetical protein